MRIFLLSALLLICGLKTFSQDLTGTWEGVGNNYKIVIIQVNDSCFGYTYDTGLGFCKANFAGSFNDSTKKLKGVNTNFIERTFTHGLSSYEVKYSVEHGEEYLKGKATPKQSIAKVLSFGIGTPVAYRKVSNRFDTTVFIAAKLALRSTKSVEEISGQEKAISTADQPLTDKQQIAVLQHQKEARKSQIVNTLVTEADSLRLLLFDNGEIDNDTVTVFHNGKIIINQLGLTVKPYEFIIPINTVDTVHSIELMANNLGSIPPNTAYLTIWAGRESYALRVSSDYSINARIDIRRRQKTK